MNISYIDNKDSESIVWNENHVTITGKRAKALFESLGDRFEEEMLFARCFIYTYQLQPVPNNSGFLTFQKLKVFETLPEAQAFLHEQYEIGYSKYHNGFILILYDNPITYNCFVDWGEDWEREQWFRRLLHGSDGKFYLKSTSVRWEYTERGKERKFTNEMKEITEAEAEEIFNKRRKIGQYWDNLIAKKKKEESN